VIEPNLDDLTQIAQTTLLEALQTQAGVECILENGAIQVNLSGIQSIVPRVLEVSETGGGCVAQLGIRVSAESISQEGIIDVIAGIERAPYLAVRSAVDKWLRFTFPPIRAAFASDDEPVYGAGITQLVAQSDEQWQIFSSNPLMIGMLQDQALLEQSLSGKRIFPDVVGDPLALRLSEEARSIHWLKLTVTSVSGSLLAECQFDNHEWQALDDLLASELEFPPLVGDFLSLKQVLVIRPA
jgi:Family of unknown function (DUF6348)